MKQHPSTAVCTAEHASTARTAKHPSTAVCTASAVDGAVPSLRILSDSGFLRRVRPNFPVNFSLVLPVLLRRSSTNNPANLSASIHTRLIFTQHQERKKKLTSCLPASERWGVFSHKANWLLEG
jgi:hypothetical protein